MTVKDVINKSTWGTGGPGYRFNDELVGNEQYTLGTLAMANAGPNTNGSQFFITHAPTPHLNDRHTIFGEVTKGMEVVLELKQGDRINSIEFLDPATPLLGALSPRVEQWNKMLKR